MIKINDRIERSFVYTNDGFLSRSKGRDFWQSGDFAWYRSTVTFDEQDRIIRLDKGWSYD